MSNYALAVIDGTGPYDDTEYTRTMNQSFCSQLARALGPDARYERGPSFDGIRMQERAGRAVDFLRAHPGKDWMLAGYSRGGCAAVMAAMRLKESGEKVKFLFLFDPVSRQFSGDTGVIPGNVGEAWVARREIGAAAMEKYDDYLSLDPGGYNPVRNWFGTTATEAEPGVRVTRDKFLGSHGALGGVGWPKVIEDTQCQADVAKFMNAGLAKAGLPVRLAPRSSDAPLPHPRVGRATASWASATKKPGQKLLGTRRRPP